MGLICIYTHELYIHTVYICIRAIPPSSAQRNTKAPAICRLSIKAPFGKHKNRRVLARARKEEPENIAVSVSID